MLEWKHYTNSSLPKTTFFSLYVGFPEEGFYNYKVFNEVVANRSRSSIVNSLDCLNNTYQISPG